MTHLERLPSYDVVIPCFNRAHVLEDAVASVLAQAHPASRVIVVDDGSTDDGAALIRRMARENATVVPLLAPRNGGASTARNIGIAASTADWIGFLDSDDVWAKDAAALLLAAGARDRLDVVVGLFARITRDGVVGEPECGWNGGNIRSALAGGGVVGTSWSVLRREKVYAAGGYDPSFRTCEDWEFFVRVAATGARFGRVDQLVAYYRAVGGERLIEDDADLAANRLRVLAHPYLSRRTPAQPSPADQLN